MTVTEVDHARACLDLLAANASLTVHEGELPVGATTVTPPFVSVIAVVEWLPRREDRSGGLDGLSGTCLVSLYCRCVGETVDATLAVSGQVRSSLLNARPTIAGRVVNMIEQVSTSPVEPNEQLGRSLFEVLAIYELETRPG